MNKKVSLIFPVYGQALMLEKALTTLRRVTAYSNYEIILVDDGSVEDMSSVYDQKTDLFDKLILLEENTGNSTIVVNRGVSVATGQIIQYQNTDVYFEGPYWLDRIVENLDESTGAIGPVLLYPDSSIQSAGLYYDDQGNNRHMGRGRSLESIGSGTLSVPMVTGCGLTTWKHLVEENNGFTVFDPYGWDDTDWCLRVRKKGYDVKLCKDSYFYHYGTVTYKGKKTKSYNLNRDYILNSYRDILGTEQNKRRTIVEKTEKALFFAHSFEAEAIQKDIDTIQSLLNKGIDVTVISFKRGEQEAFYRKLGCRAFATYRSITDKISKNDGFLYKSRRFLRNMLSLLVNIDSLYDLFQFIRNEEFNYIYHNKKNIIKVLSVLSGNRYSMRDVE